MFDYDLAFSRNLGWFTEEDQKIIKNAKIAFPGLGGVGSHHLLSFARLGVENFHLADPDIYELQNFNRQLFATVDTIKLNKTDVSEEFLKKINPEIKCKKFSEGITDANLDEFLNGVDLVVDTIDLYEMDYRIKIFKRARELGIPVITAGPFGMGTSIIAFHPQKMSFNEYFNLNRTDLTVEAKIIRFLAGIAPRIIHQKYLRNRSAVNLFKKKLPSLNIGCTAASSALCSYAVRILLNREDSSIRWAPKGFHVDFYLHKSYRFFIPFGNKNPLQVLKIKIYHKFFHAKEYLD